MTKLYTVGRNRPGYLPESDPYYVGTDAQDAREALTTMMHEYAGQDDENRWLYLTGLSREEAIAAGYPVKDTGPFWTTDFGDDNPSMLATVESILTDSPPEPGQEYGAIVEDNDGHDVSFWLMVEYVPEEVAAERIDAWDR